MSNAAPTKNQSLEARIVQLGRELGFSAVGIADIALEREAEGFQAWIASGQHGEMEYMARHGSLRWQPDELQPGTQSVICVALDYWPGDIGHTVAESPLPPGGRVRERDWANQAKSDEPVAAHRQHIDAAEAPNHPLPNPPPRGEGASGFSDALATLESPHRAYVSRYALGRDYHKVLRNKLQGFAEAISTQISPHEFRVFTDSAPVMEIPLAVKAGLGWRGKHTLLLNREQGSMFFLGEIYTSLKLVPPAPQNDHCGSCTACIDVCPTQAITAPHRLDARKCISYLTIELKTAIPVEFRKAIGNRIYGCDDCQLVCPWNKFAQRTPIPDFEPRNGLDSAMLVELFAWTETDFNERLQGSPIRRIGHERWLRNIAVALGNAPTSPAITAALQARATHASELVHEHVAWALAQQTAR
jgi:epoxyqueuosine reductase